MKREIKFIAWDKIKSIMRGVVRVDFDNPSFNVQILCPTESAPQNWELRKFDEVELMQFTGLTDKNGKEVFDGDIVACYDWGGKNPFIKNDSIVWDADENGWNFNSNWVEDRYDFRKAISVCEVIGNIYENPNLLK